MNSKKIRWNRVLMLLGGTAALLLVCCVGVLLLAPNIRRTINAPFWNTDVRVAAQAAHRMLEYELPPNYQETRALTVQQDAAIVIIADRAEPRNLIAMQSVPGDETSAWQSTYEERWSREIGDHTYDTRRVSSHNVMIRGQEHPVRILEGTDEGGRKIRQAACVLSGKSGNVLVVVVGGQDTWDQEMVDAFFASIH